MDHCFGTIIRGHWYSDLWMACAVKIAFSASGSWEACEHAPVKSQSPQEFAVVDLGASGPEVLLHALPSCRLISRAGRAGQVKGIDQSCTIGCLFWRVRCRDRGAGSRHQVGDLPVIVRGDPCFGFAGWWCRRVRCVASCGAPRLPGAIKWSSRDQSLSRPWFTSMMQGGYWLDGSFFWTFVRRLEIFFFLPRPAERRQQR